MQIILWVFWLILQWVDVCTFCLLFSYLIKVVALLFFICCYHHVLVNKDIHYSSPVLTALVLRLVWLLHLGRVDDGDNAGDTNETSMSLQHERRYFRGYSNVHKRQCGIIWWKFFCRKIMLDACSRSIRHQRLTETRTVRQTHASIELLDKNRLIFDRYIYKENYLDVDILWGTVTVHCMRQGGPEWLTGKARIPRRWRRHRHVHRHPREDPREEIARAWDVRM